MLRFVEFFISVTLHCYENVDASTLRSSSTTNIEIVVVSLSTGGLKVNVYTPFFFVFATGKFLTY